MKLKAPLALAATTLAAALPIAFAADAASLIPADTLATTSVFSGFVIALVLLSVFADYAPSGSRFVGRPLTASTTPAAAPVRPHRAAHPLAA